MKQCYKITQQVQEGVEKLVTEISFEMSDYSNIHWDSKTGLITTEIDGVTTALPHTGNSCIQLTPGLPVKIYGAIDNDGEKQWEEATNIKLNYHYWYY